MQRLHSTFSLAHLLMVVAGLVTFVAIAVVLRDRAAVLEVVVASEALDEGSPIARAPLGVVEISANDPLASFFVAAGTDVTDQFLSRPVAKGEPLLLSDLQAADDAPGRRTMTLSVDQLVLSGLGLRLGDRVDLIATSSDGASGFVVADVEVVRLPASEALPGFGAAAGASWLTIEVSEPQALAIASANATADVDVVRSSGARPLEHLDVVADGGGS